MPSEFENQVNDLLESGSISEEQAQALLDGSRLRQEVNDREQRLAAVEAENQKLRQSVLRSTFEKAGVTADPSVISLPTDLNTEDPDAVRTWAIDKGLIAAPPDTARGELVTHDRIAAAASGAEDLSAGQPDIAAEIQAAQTPEEVMAIVDRYGPKHGLQRAASQ